MSASLEDVEVGLLRRQLLRLAGLVLVEAHDEWQVADKRYLSETSLALLHKPSDQPLQNVATPAALTA